jgi:deoxyribose-phosphate aldolase
MTFIKDHIEFTLLRSICTESDISQLIEVCIVQGYPAICIPPTYLSFVRDKIQSFYNVELELVTVVGFPLGYVPTKIKVAESLNYLSLGANHIDAVVSLCDVKSGNWDRVHAEILQITNAVHDNNGIAKFIFETGDLLTNEIIKLCDICNLVGVDYVKTSTGFGSRGASLGDIEILKTYIDPKIKIKASGGIKTSADALALIEAGAHRIGTSSTIF